MDIPTMPDSSLSIPDAGENLGRRSPIAANRFNRRASKVILDIRGAAIAELPGMERGADLASMERMNRITACLDDRLAIISGLSESDRIDPFLQLNAGGSGGSVPVEGRPLRIGVNTPAANPLHWGHLLVALAVMASMSQGEVVFIIAGEDCRKPSMLSAHERHRIGRSVIEMLYPLFAYSSIALGTDEEGEADFGRLLGLNSGRRMEPFYIAGADHYRRVTERGEPDAIQELEWIAEEQMASGCELHAVSAVFTERRGAKVQRGNIATTLRTHILPALPVAFSSTAVRHARSPDGGATCAAAAASGAPADTEPGR